MGEVEVKEAKPVEGLDQFGDIIATRRATSPKTAYFLGDQGVAITKP